MIRILYCSSSSACLELKNKNPYYAPAPYTVLVDGKEAFRSETNVFSLYDLRPDTEYTVVVRPDSGEEQTVLIRTKSETCCVSVKDFGAVGDGVHEDTGALQAAINFLPDGGRLLFPAGTYLTLPLALKSHITLDLAEGAVLLGSPQRERYPIISGIAIDPVSGQEVPLAMFEGLEQSSYQSLLQANCAEDIAIVGRGTIDGNGQNGGWWVGFHDFPASRPRVIFLNRCKGVTLHGVTVANGPAWHIHPCFSRDVSL